MSDKNIFHQEPSCFTVDISGKCNLHCTYCPEGQHLNNQPVKQMSRQNFAAVFHSLPVKTTNIGLSNWSEPFLNSGFIQIMKLTKQERPKIKIWASSNGNTLNRDLAEELVVGGLDYLDITISGLTETAYQRYHQHGKLARVWDGINAITKAKQKYHTNKPNLTINYLLFPYNVADQKTILAAISQKLYDKNQIDLIDSVRIIRGTILGSPAVQQFYFDHFTGAASYKYVTQFKNLCLQVFLNPAIRADGAVFPCCIIEYQENLNMGNLFEQNFSDIWNSEKYVSFRNDFLTGRNPICNSCYLRYPSLPLMRTKLLGVRFKTDLKIVVLKAMDAFFQFDRRYLQNHFFQTWVQAHLRKKNKPSTASV